jgi:hypothetical protein
MPRVNGTGWSWRLYAATVAAVLSCGDHPVAPADDPAAPGIVSEPVAPPGSVASHAAGVPLAAFYGATADPVAYVSVPSGTFPDGVSATIRNVTSGGPSTEALPVVAGGLDPVPITARVGDEIEVSVLNAWGIASLSLHRVPRRRPPRVVRTDPPKGKTDVALNITIVIVLSEPIAPSTVTAAAVGLTRDGRPVSARLALSPDGLRIELVPSTPLAPNATYTLSITEALRDAAAGDPVQPAEHVTFTTTSGEPWLSDVLNLPPPSAEIAFVSTRGGDTAVYVMNADGSDVTRIMRGSGVAWSPDGSRLAIVTRGNGGLHDIYILNTDGSGITALAATAADEREPAWSPDGRRIAYTRHDKIVIENGDSNVLMEGAGPTWAPDGSRIAFSKFANGPFVSTKAGYLRGHSLFVADTKGGQELQLTDNDTTVATTPAWSPDGSRIAFAMGRLDRAVRIRRSLVYVPGGIHVVNPDGTNLVAVTDPLAGGSWPAWSPDGSRIAFTLQPLEGRGQIHIVSADGLGLVNLSRNEYDEWYPSWRRPR